jgi:hypothetical protein
MDFPDGTPAQLATSPTLGLIGPQWSADGRTLVGTSNTIQIVAIRLESPQDAVTLVPNGSQAQLSPDGRWLAFSSTLSGRPEVYVQRFPEGTDLERVSTDGGAQPRWRGDGRELFYLANDGSVVALEIRTNPAFQAGAMSRLFRDQLLRAGATPFDYSYLPSPDGQGFLIRVPAEGPPPMTAVTNWLSSSTP